MKRFFSFALMLSLFISSFAVFTACNEKTDDQPSAHEHAFSEGVLVLPATDATGVKKISVCSGCGEEQEALIPFSQTTEDKWIKMLSPQNYTVTISYGTGVTASYVVTEDGYLMEETVRDFEQYVVKEDDGWYRVTLTEEGYQSVKIAVAPGLSIGELIAPGMDGQFGSFEYSEEWSSYVYVREERLKYFIYTADDTLVRIIGFGGDHLDDVTPNSAATDDYSRFVFDFHSYGTTTLDVPDYK